MSAEIINFAQRKQAKNLPGEAETNRPLEEDYVSRLSYGRWTSPKLRALPFGHETEWFDDPTGDVLVDYDSGQRYARDIIKVVIEDGLVSFGLEKLVRNMINQGFARRGPRGKLCRKISDCAEGFLSEICRIAVEAARQNGGLPPPRFER